MKCMHYFKYIYILYYIVLCSTAMVKDQDYLSAILDPKADTSFQTHPYTYLVGYHWRLDYANKNATHNLRLRTKQ